MGFDAVKPSEERTSANNLLISKVADLRAQKGSEEECEVSADRTSRESASSHVYQEKKIHEKILIQDRSCNRS